MTYVYINLLPRLFSESFPGTRVVKIKADRSGIDELLIYLADRLTYAH